MARADDIALLVGTQVRGTPTGTPTLTLPHDVSVQKLRDFVWVLELVLYSRARILYMIAEL